MASANTEAAPLYRPITLQLEEWTAFLSEEGKKERHKIKQVKCSTESDNPSKFMEGPLEIQHVVCSHLAQAIWCDAVEVEAGEDIGAAKDAIEQVSSINLCVRGVVGKTLMVEELGRWKVNAAVRSF
nr:hypothetical protein [Tanacetum cinerariifolium]GEW57661.1 hypothetical protein [Tanacetum cinerariifolium]GEW57762.1 hypothetical protein [Tanacetum cinerariifolium]